MKKILVTGGSGFIGSHTCLVFLNNGYEIYVLDSNINSHSNSLDKIVEITGNPNLHFYKGDVRDKEVLDKIFRDAQEIGECCGPWHKMWVLWNKEKIQHKTN